MNHIEKRLILDTNVVSEIIKAQPNNNVIAWFAEQKVSNLYLTTIVIAELYYGMLVLPEGKRKSILHEKLNKFVQQFDGRIFDFELDTALTYAEVMANARRSGLAIQKADGYIASIAKTKGFAVVTRDVSPFHSAGVDVVNPWET